MQVFDLGELSRQKRETTIGLRWLSGIFCVIFSIVAISNISIAWGLMKTGPLDRLQYLVLLVSVGGMLFAIGVCLWTIIKFGPGATQLVIDDHGLSFRWPSGRLNRRRWQDLSHGFLVFDYSLDPTLPTLTQALWEIRQWNRPVIFLTREAFEAII